MVKSKRQPSKLPLRKRSVSNNTARSINLKARDAILQPMVDNIIREEKKAAEKQTSSSKRPASYGLISNVVNESKVLLPWLTTNLLKKHCSRRRLQLKAQQQEERLTIPSSQQHPHVVDDSVLPTPVPGQSFLPPPPPPTSDTNPSSTSTTNNNNSPPPTTTAATTTNNPPPCQTKPLGGRPKGSTTAFKKHREQCELAAVNEIATLYSSSVSNAKSKMKRVKKNTYKKIVDDVKKKKTYHRRFVCRSRPYQMRIPIST